MIFCINRTSSSSQAFENLLTIVGGLDFELPKLQHSSGMTNFTDRNSDSSYRSVNMGQGWNEEPPSWVGKGDVHKVTLRINDDKVKAALKGPVVIYDDDGGFQIGKVQTKLQAGPKNALSIDEIHNVELGAGQFFHMKATQAQVYTSLGNINKIDFDHIQSQMDFVGISDVNLITSDWNGQVNQLENEIGDINTEMDDLTEHFKHYAYDEAWYVDIAGGDTVEGYVDEIQAYMLAAKTAYESWVDTMPEWSADIWDSAIVTLEHSNEYIALFNALALVSSYGSFAYTETITKSSWFGLANSGFGNVGGIIGNSISDPLDEDDPENFEFETFEVTEMLEISYDYARENDPSAILDTQFDNAKIARENAGDAYEDLVFNTVVAGLAHSHAGATEAELRAALGDLGFKTRIVEREEHYYGYPGPGGSYYALGETYIAIDDDRTSVNASLDSGEYLLFSIDDYEWERNDLSHSRTNFVGSWQDDNF